MTHRSRMHATHDGHFLRSLTLAALVTGTLLVPPPTTHAASTPEQTCLKGRSSALAKYAACHQKALAKFYAANSFAKLRAASSKCPVKYAAVWPKLQAKTPGSSCDTARFTDNGTTVTDHLTGLQWEKKTTAVGSGANLADPHDVDNLYSWSAVVPAADGPLFTTFLAAVNGGGCFAGQCDWRLPTFLELQTIVLEEYPCTTIPCIDPLFGSTINNVYWSATTRADDTNRSWGVVFTGGSVDIIDRGPTAYVRAVRGG